MSYTFLQHYWWFLVSLLGALFVFLTFVQGANTLIFTLGRTERERRMIIASTGRKWELTFTTLVTFGGAFFASFPLFYSTSFGGAYWVWMLILFSFVLQAVAYEFQANGSNVFGSGVYRAFLVLNGVVGPLLVGTAVSTFFHGAHFVVDRDVMGVGAAISSWTSAWHGLEAVCNPWNLVLGVAVMLLSQTLGLLYLMNNVRDENLRCRASVRLWSVAVPFAVLFVSYVIHLFFSSGWGVNADGVVRVEPFKYFNNFLDMPVVAVMFLVGVAFVVAGVVINLFTRLVSGIWFSGIGTVLTVLALLLLAGWNGTAFYPSLSDTQSSLTIANSCSSQFTLTVMSAVSLIIPFVIAYIVWAWRSLDRGGISGDEA